MKKENNRKEQRQYQFELTLKDGRTRGFHTGLEMYNWARSNNPRWLFDEADSWKFKDKDKEEE